MKTLRILYVEDNADLRTLIGLMLEDEGRDIAHAADGADAWEQWQKGAFNLLITDVSLPGLSGWELAKRVLATNPEQWIVLCSGHAMPNDLRELGPNVRAMLKPFGIDEVDAMMAEFLRSRGD